MKTSTSLLIALVLCIVTSGCKKTADNSANTAQTAAQNTSPTPTPASPAPGSPATPASPSAEADIRAAIGAHLAQKSNLNLKAFDTNVTKVTLQGDRAEAHVSFELKNGPGAMQMLYHLQKGAAGWKVLDSAPDQSDLSHPPTEHGTSGGTTATPGANRSLSDTLRSFKESGASGSAQNSPSSGK